MSSTSAAVRRGNPTLGRRGDAAATTTPPRRGRSRTRQLEQSSQQEPEQGAIKEINVTLLFGEKVDQITMFENQLVRDLNVLIQNVFGIPIEHQIIFGWPGEEPASEATILKDLDLLSPILLQVASSAPESQQGGIEIVEPSAVLPLNKELIPSTPIHSTSAASSLLSHALSLCAMGESSNQVQESDDVFIHVYVLTNEEPHEVTFKSNQTIHYIKRLFVEITNIPLERQNWSGWPEEATSDTCMLKDLNLDKPVHSVRLIEKINEAGDARWNGVGQMITNGEAARNGNPVDDRKRKALFVDDGELPSSSKYALTEIPKWYSDLTAPPCYSKVVELMEKQGLIYSTENSECPICFTELNIGEGILLRDCLHTFCSDCLLGYIQHGEDPVVKCPYVDDNYSCSSYLHQTEIKALVPSEIYEKYLQRSVKLAENQMSNSFHCKTPDCISWCTFEDDVNQFPCPVCLKQNCITCAAIHEGQNCKEYQRDLQINAETDVNAKKSLELLKKEIKAGQALHCPKCSVVIMKKIGCDWVVCSYCKTEICWVTKGPRWGPKGHGDTSGGCKCRVNGKLCHPKCGNCH